MSNISNPKAAQKSAPNSSASSAKSETGHVQFDGRPLNDRLQGVYSRVRQLLDENRADDALGVVRGAGLGEPLLKNFHGVCLMRAGQYEQAVRAFRELVLVSGGVCLRPDAPTLFKANFATALLLNGNVAGCVGTLDEIGDEQHPTVQRLRTAIAEWKRGLSFGQKLAWFFGTEPDRPVELDGPPGELL